ncbi:MAG: CvpA family protein [Epulopiscium sp.]|nr:CvpA family protein [Candidatus Epulonipiscium sp.]
MNWMDIVVLIICFLNGLKVYKRGFVASLIQVSFYGVGFFVAYRIYPTISRFLREATELFSWLKMKWTPVIKIESTIEQYTLQAQQNIIRNLPLPQILKVRLIENNNSEIYKILNVEGLDDYIAGYLANMLLNIISIILVVMIIFAGLQIVIKTTDILTQLPGIHFLNKTGGLILGLSLGVVKIWIMYSLLLLFYAHPKVAIIQQAIDQSLVARYLYEKNMLLSLLSKVFY